MSDESMPSIPSSEFKTLCWNVPTESIVLEGDTLVSEDVEEEKIEKRPDSRLTMLEKNLLEAETRCGVLRQHVQYMKMLYTAKNPVESDAVVHVKPSGSSAFSFKMDHNGGSQGDFSSVEAQKDPIEVVQYILSEMTQSINEVEDYDSSSEFNKAIKSSMRRRPKHKKRSKTTVSDYRGPEAFGKDTTSLAPVKRRTLEIMYKSGTAAKKPLKNQLRKSQTSPRPVTKYKGGAQSPGKDTALTLLHKSSTGNEVRGLTRNRKLRMTGSYQLSTVASRMKCTPKSYNSNASFKRIPFSVGKSTTKSHNLGIKIQETWSLIKLAAARRGRNMVGSSQTEYFNHLLHEGGATAVHSASAILIKPRYILGRGSAGNLAQSNQNVQNKGSGISVGASVDFKSYQLRGVLQKLHDEFSAMTERYDTLQRELKLISDPVLEKELQKLEESLNVKENEINAFMDLYNEVTHLKERLNSMKTTQPKCTARQRRAKLGSSNSHSTFTMTRLLRKIEGFQDSLRIP